MSTTSTFLGTLMPNAIEFPAGNTTTPTFVTGATINTEIAAEQAAAPAQGATLGAGAGQSKGALGGGSQQSQPAPQNTLALSGSVVLPAGTLVGSYITVVITDTTTGNVVMSSSRIVTQADITAGSKQWSLGGSTSATDVSTLSVDLSLTPDSGVGPKSQEVLPALVTAQIDAFTITPAQSAPAQQ